MPEIAKRKLRRLVKQRVCHTPSVVQAQTIKDLPIPLRIRLSAQGTQFGGVLVEDTNRYYYPRLSSLVTNIYATLLKEKMLGVISGTFCNYLGRMSRLTGLSQKFISALLSTHRLEEIHRYNCLKAHSYTTKAGFFDSHMVYLVIDRINSLLLSEAHEGRTHYSIFNPKQRLIHYCGLEEDCLAFSVHEL